MQIHELNTKALTDPAWVPFDDGSDTYKADFNQIIDDAVAAAFTSADVSGGVVEYESEDAEPLSDAAWSPFDLLEGGENLETLFTLVSEMAYNVRWLYSKLGTTDISSIGNGTVTGALSQLNSNPVIKSKSFTGTTNSIGLISGGLSDFGITDGTLILAAYVNRGTLDVYRKATIYNYGSAGFAIRFTQTTSDTPINGQQVNCTIYYI